MVVLAFLTDPAVVAKILGHLGLPTTAPALAPARSSGSPLGFELRWDGFGGEPEERDRRGRKDEAPGEGRSPP